MHGTLFLKMSTTYKPWSLRTKKYNYTMMKYGATFYNRHTLTQPSRMDRITNNNTQLTKIFIAFSKFLGFSIFRMSIFDLTHVRTGVCQATPLRYAIVTPPHPQWITNLNFTNGCVYSDKFEIYRSLPTWITICGNKQRHAVNVSDNCSWFLFLNITKHDFFSTGSDTMRAGANV